MEHTPTCTVHHIYGAHTYMYSTPYLWSTHLHVQYTISMEHTPTCTVHHIYGAHTYMYISMEHTLNVQYTHTIQCIYMYGSTTPVQYTMCNDTCSLITAHGHAYGTMYTITVLQGMFTQAVIISFHLHVPCIKGLHTMGCYWLQSRDNYNALTPDICPANLVFFCFVMCVNATRTALYRHETFGTSWA